MSVDRPDNMVGLEIMASNAANPANDLSAHGPEPNFWEGSSHDGFFSGFSPTVQSFAPSEDIFALVDQLNSPARLQGLPSADDFYTMVPKSSTPLDMNVDPLLASWEDVLPPRPRPQCLGTATSLMRFREEMVQRIVVLDTYFSDPLQVLHGCKEEGAGTGDPTSLLLTCTKEFIDIIQSLNPTPPTDSCIREQLDSYQFAPAMDTQTEDAPSTEVVLLALSSYLALMRLYDSLFHCIYKLLCQMPSDSFKSIKIKSVLRIGGISSLQDMPLKTYANSILDVIRSQLQTLESCLGIPTEYCLSGTSTIGHMAATPGLFSRPDRAQLFSAVMLQHDIKPRRGGKSYVESIRASIEDSLGLLDD